MDNTPPLSDATQSYTNQWYKSPCRVGLVAFAIILMIGAGVAAGLLNADLGNNSFSFLATVPVAVVLIAATCYISPATFRKEVSLEEDIETQYPLGGSTLDTQIKLRQLTESRLQKIGHLLSGERLVLLENCQLPHLPWKKIVTSPEKINALFPEDDEKTATARLKALWGNPLTLIGNALSVKQISFLPTQSWESLPWEEIKKSPEKFDALFPMDTDEDQASTSEWLNNIKNLPLLKKMGHLFSPEQVERLILPQNKSYLGKNN